MQPLALTDAKVAAYGRFDGVPSRADLERFFLLDDADKLCSGIACKRSTAFDPGE